MTESTAVQIEGAKSIVRRRNYGLFLMLLYVPTVVVIHKVTGSDSLAKTAAILLMCVVIGLMLSVAFAKCPRCKNMFYTKWYSKGV